ncbi:proteasome core particle subunit alpha 3 [Pichia kluyveri]|uniref:Proteasome subunit alpha type n=1 Tax=Pichia kluyveri TaxID=36015 RepID=A0AAV5R2H4_PICKL|nr:proteasome core particle subunit alpha 3 [Pichia kluyveri]
MSRRYDSRTTIFSPEGRLYQVEYALEAIAHAGTTLAILSPKEGIVLLAERKIISKLLESSSNSEKIYKINDQTIVSVAGLTADAEILIDRMRNDCQQYLKIYNKLPNTMQVVNKVCDFKQGYTQFGGLRPFGVSFLFAGYDSLNGFQLYSSNPSGNYSGWLATSIGENSSSVQTLLKQELNANSTESHNDITLDDALKIALKVLSKTSDNTHLSADKLELASLSLQSNTNKPTIKLYTPKEIDNLLNLHDLSKKEEE